MKGNKKVLVAAVLLLLLAVSFGTYAIYRTNFAGNTTVKTATWSALLKDGEDASETLDFTLADFDCGGTQGAPVHGKNNTIAPGDTCTLSFKVDLDGSEVDAIVEASADLTAVNAIGNNRITASFSASPAISNGKVSVPYSATATEMEVTYTLTLAWDGTDSDETINPADVALNNKNLVIPVTVTAYQDMGD